MILHDYSLHTGKEDPRRKRKPEDRPQRRSARSTYNGGSSECSTCGQSFPSQASLRKHMLDECREEQSYRRRKKKDKDSPTATPTPELIKVPATGGVDGWGEDYLDGKGPEQLQCRDCSGGLKSVFRKCLHNYRFVQIVLKSQMYIHSD